MKAHSREMFCTGSRRHVLKIGGLAAAAMAMDPLSSIRHAMGLTGRDGFEDFAETWHELATELAAGDLQDDVFLHRLAGALTELGPEGVPPRMRVVYDKDGMRSGPAYYEKGLLIVVVEMGPNTLIPPHWHHAHDILTVGLSGMCTYEHFQVMAEAPDSDDTKTEWQVQKTVSGIMTSGRSSSLTVGRDHIHSFRAGPDGAIILDFLTKVEDAEQTPIIHIDAEAEDSFLGIHQAHWTEKNF